MVSIKVLVMLFGICVLTTKTSAVRLGCCKDYMKGRLRFGAIEGYSVQIANELCPINAIIFHTKNDKRCTDPTENWVMQYVRRFRNKALKVHMNAAQKPQ